MAPDEPTVQPGLALLGFGLLVLAAGLFFFL